MQKHSFFYNYSSFTDSSCIYPVSIVYAKHFSAVNQKICKNDCY